MWILIAEMLFALLIIIFIFWWTMRARVDPAEAEEKAKDESTQKTESLESQVDSSMQKKPNVD